MSKAALLLLLVVTFIGLVTDLMGQSVSSAVAEADRRLYEKEMGYSTSAETTETLRLEYSIALRRYLAEITEVSTLDREAMHDLRNIYFATILSEQHLLEREWQEPPLLVLKATLVSLLQRPEAKADSRLRCVLMDRLNQLNVYLGEYEDVIRDTKLIVLALRDESVERPWQGDVDGYGKVERSHETLVENWEMDFFAPGIYGPLSRMIAFRMVSPSQAEAIRTDPELNGMGQLADAFAIYDGTQTFEDLREKAREGQSASIGWQ